MGSRFLIEGPANLVPRVFFLAQGSGADHFGNFHRTYVTCEIERLKHIALSVFIQIQGCRKHPRTGGHLLARALLDKKKGHEPRIKKRLLECQTARILVEILKLRELTLLNMVHVQCIQSAYVITLHNLATSK